MIKYYKPYITLIIILIILLMPACSHHKTSIESEESGKVLKVEVIKPQINDYTEPFTLSGTIKSYQTSVLSGKIMEQVVDVLVEEGNYVKLGQVLIKLDDRNSKLAMARVEAEAYKLKSVQDELNSKLDEIKSRVQMLFHDQEKYLAQSELAQATFDRFSKLREKEVVTQQEFEEVKANLDTANATVSKSQAEYNLFMAQKKQLDAQNQQLIAKIEANKADMAEAIVNRSYTQITSSLNGVIIHKDVDVGDMTVPGQPLITVENPNALYLEINVEESYAFLLKPGSKIDVKIDAYPKATIPAIIREIVPAADPSTHTFKVKIDLPVHKAIHSGMYARVVLPMGGKNIFVPRTAIVTKGQVVGVFVVDEKNVARFRIIKEGQEIQGFVEIISGLTEEDKVVISNLENMTDGTKVIVLGES